VVEYREASYNDVPLLLREMREADRQEVMAASPGPLDDTIAQALWTSADPLAALHEGRLLALFGYAPVSPRSAVIWLLGTDHLMRHHSDLARAGRAYTARVLTLYPHLFNYVDARNTASKLWLRRLGFTLRPAAPFGHTGALFHRFDMEA
jgi:hypothetical protein